MKLQSQAIASSEQFKTNKASHTQALEQIREAAALAAAGGGEGAGARAEMVLRCDGVWL